jgi:hypothetical protein
MTKTFLIEVLNLVIGAYLQFGAWYLVLIHILS